MPFDYYHRLSRRQQSVYRQSDIAEVSLPAASALRSGIEDLNHALLEENRNQVQKACNALVRQISTQLQIPAAEVKVLTRRPSADWGELHGLYEPSEDGDRARITVWMRTAKRKQVVAFKTFLRTLLHEVGHHLDYEYFRFPDSFHTEGFYKRENALYRALTEPAKNTQPKQYELSLDSN